MRQTLWQGSKSTVMLMYLFSPGVSPTTSDASISDGYVCKVNPKLTVFYLLKEVIKINNFF